MPGDFDYLMWAYRAVFKQTDGGGGSIVVNFVANERTVFLYGNIGKNDYAANRSIDAFIFDENDDKAGIVLASTSVDNVDTPIFVSASVAITAQTTISSQDRLVLGKGDKLVIRAAALVQNEELTLALRALFKSWPPTITTTGSGGTVTTTLSYDKVI